MRAPHASSIELAARVGASAQVGRVVASSTLSPSLREVVIEGPVALAGVAGNDVMVQVTSAEGRLVRRRYSVAAVDEHAGTFTLWVTTEHDGPGATWAVEARPGDEVDLIGPRGKIPLDETADWHLFIGDASALGAFYRMARSIEVPGRAIFIVEVDEPDDALTTTFDEGLGVTGIFVDRMGRARDDAAGLLGGLAAFALPPDEGHAYIFGEFHVMRVIQSALLDRGLEAGQISLKAFWRAGRGNAEHGEPDKGD